MEEDQGLRPSLTEPYYYAYSVEQAGSTLSQIRAKLAPHRFRLAAKKIVKELDVQSADRVLEVGSGLGFLGKEIKTLASVDLKYVGLDLVYSSLAKGEQAVAPIQADAVTLPFADNSYDKVISTDVLEHVPEAQSAVAEIYRVLKPGGKAFLVIADPYEARFTNVSGHIKRSKEKTDVPWWESLFKQTGFEVLSEASDKYRRRDWRRVFNLPFLVRLKDKPGFACAFSPVHRPGTYILQKPA